MKLEHILTHFVKPKLYGGIHLDGGSFIDPK